MTATLYGLGVGPGDPDLITIKALNILKSAPVIAYPAPDDGDSLARAIAAPHLPGDQIEIAIGVEITEGHGTAVEGSQLLATVGEDTETVIEKDQVWRGAGVGEDEIGVTVRVKIADRHIVAQGNP